MRNTAIEWCDDTVNPTEGCDGCELYTPPKPRIELPLADQAGEKPEDHCYAKGIHEHYHGEGSFAVVSLQPGRMARALRARDLTGKVRPKKPWLNGMPRCIFVGDMSDIFSKAVPFEYLESEIIEPARSGPHVLMLLTKRPHRMAEFDQWLQGRGKSWPKNVWAGTSVTSQATVGRVGELLGVRAALRFISAEPLLGAVEIPHLHMLSAIRPNGWWLIAGGESGKGARPMHPAWVRNLRDQCLSAEVPFFFKQWGEHVALDQVPGLFERRTSPEIGPVLRWPFGLDEPGIARIGKKAAGRLLDGRKWDAIPAATGGRS